eukprot:Skav203418  [mRNA]  locus=scaffold1743:340010:341363:- [translate_table: standard]
MDVETLELDRLQSLLSSSEPELALRGAAVLAPRLTDATGAMPEPGSTTFEARVVMTEPRR